MVETCLPNNLRDIQICVNRLLGHDIHEKVKEEGEKECDDEDLEKNKI